MTTPLDPHSVIIMGSAHQILPIHRPDCRYIKLVRARDGLIKDNLGHGTVRTEGYFYGAGYRKLVVFPKSANSSEFVAEVERWLVPSNKTEGQKISCSTALYSVEEFWISVGKPVLWLPADTFNFICAYFSNRIAEWAACDVEMRELVAQTDWLHRDLQTVVRFLEATKGLNNDLSAFMKAVHYLPPGLERTWRFFTDEHLQPSIHKASRAFVGLLRPAYQVEEVL